MGFSWDMMAGLKRLPTLSYHDGCVNSVMFSPDGRLMVSGSDDRTVKLWDMYANPHSSVKDALLLANIQTQHTQNIFCAAVCPNDNNCVISCAADGTLRSNDLSGFDRQSRVPGRETVLVRSSGIMHQFIFDQTQPKILYTAEDGGRIRRVDLRIAQNVPRSAGAGAGLEGGAGATPGVDVVFKNYVSAQAVGPKLGAVKALVQCAEGGSRGSSHHLFVGGVGYSVGVLDLRMNQERKTMIENRILRGNLRQSAADGSSSDGSGDGEYDSDDSGGPASSALSNKELRSLLFVQMYSPQYHGSGEQGSGQLISLTSSAYHNRAQGKQISVSGMACSRQGVLAVSYQGDQVYTFDIGVGSRAHSQTDCDIQRIGPRSVLGGHINYATFLKSVSFFGPNDEYIVAGSDSGCMWIWDANSGIIADTAGDTVGSVGPKIAHPCRVVNMLTADSNTCNGVAAHPHLPLLASYGIDDDIKLWQFQSPSDSTDDKDAKEAKETQRFWYADNEHSQLPVLDFRLELSLQNVCREKHSAFHNGYKTGALFAELKPVTVQVLMKLHPINLRVLERVALWYTGYSSGGSMHIPESSSSSKNSIITTLGLIQDRISSKFVSRHLRQLRSNKLFDPTGTSCIAFPCVAASQGSECWTCSTGKCDYSHDPSDIARLAEMHIADRKQREQEKEKLEADPASPASSCDLMPANLPGVMDILQRSNVKAILSKCSAAARYKMIRSVEGTGMSDCIANIDQLASTVAQIRTCHNNPHLSDHEIDCLWGSDRSTTAHGAAYVPDFPSDFHGQKFFHYRGGQSRTGGSSAGLINSASLEDNAISGALNVDGNVGGGPVLFATVAPVLCTRTGYSVIIQAALEDFCPTFGTIPSPDNVSAGTLFREHLLKCDLAGTRSTQIQQLLRTNTALSASLEKLVTVYPTVSASLASGSVSGGGYLPLSLNKFYSSSPQTTEKMVSCLEIMVNLRHTGAAMKEEGTSAFKRAELVTSYARYEKAERYYNSVFKLAAEHLANAAQGTRGVYTTMQIATVLKPAGACAPEDANAPASANLGTAETTPEADEKCQQRKRKKPNTPKPSDASGSHLGASPDIPDSDEDSDGDCRSESVPSLVESSDSDSSCEGEEYRNKLKDGMHTDIAAVVALYLPQSSTDIEETHAKPGCRDIYMYYFNVPAVLFHNKCIHFSCFMMVEALYMRKLCYSNASAVALQMNNPHDAFYCCQAAVSIIELNREMVPANTSSYAEISMYYYAPASTFSGAANGAEKHSGENDLTPCLAHNYAIDSKIYFRLGSAELALGMFDDSIRDFNVALSLLQLQHGGGGNVIKDLAISRKIQEALKGKEIRRKREEKAYAQMFGKAK